MVLKEKHEDCNDIIACLNEIQQVQCNQRSFLANLNGCLDHIEGLYNAASSLQLQKVEAPRYNANHVLG